MKQLLFILILFCSIQGFGQIKGYWRLNGNSNDASGNGYNGSPNLVTFSQQYGKLNQGANFNGTSSYIQLPRGILGGNNEIDRTLSVWCRPTATVRDIVSFSDALSDDGTWIVGRDGVWAQVNSTTWNFYAFSNPLELNKWHHVVVTMSFNNSIKSYINGRLDSENSFPYASLWRTSTNVKYPRIGSFTQLGTSYWKGDIDELTYWIGTWGNAAIKNEYSKVKGFF